MRVRARERRRGQRTGRDPGRGRVRAGDHVDFIVQDDGTIVVRAATVDVPELKGLLHRRE